MFAVRFDTDVEKELRKQASYFTALADWNASEGREEAATMFRKAAEDRLKLLPEGPGVKEIGV